MVTMSTTSVATEVRRRVLSSHDRFWRPEDFDGSLTRWPKRCPGWPAPANFAASGGDCTGADVDPTGMAPPPPGRLAGEVVGDTGTGPSGRSAALALGLSTQVPRREAIAVPGRPPRSPGPVYYVSRAASTKRRDERLHPTEVALFEVLRDWNSLVEMPTEDAVDRITQLIDSGAIRLDRLARASKTEPPRVHERLRRLLVALDRPEIVDVIRPARSESIRHDLALAG